MAKSSPSVPGAEHALSTGVLERVTKTPRGVLLVESKGRDAGSNPLIFSSLGLGGPDSARP